MFSKLLNDIKKTLNPDFSNNPTILPVKLGKSLDEYLDDNEQFIFSMKNFRAIHKAKKSEDRNTFFNSWCILTDKRLLIVKNLNYINVFVEIQLPKITDHRVEKSDEDMNIHLYSEGIEDILEFSKHLLTYSDKFLDNFTNALKASKDKYVMNKEGKVRIKCSKCEYELLEDSKFCSNCGTKLN